MRFALTILFSLLSANAATFYVSPSATAGNGTLNDPWHISLAGTNYGAISAGDTVILLDGTYQTPFYISIGSSSGFITFRSQTRHGAKITDGLFGALTIAADASTNRMMFSGSEFWQAGQRVIVQQANGHGELVQLGGAPSNGTNWPANRGWNGTTARSHLAGERVIPISPFISITGTNIILKDIWFTSLQSTQRVIGLTNRSGIISWDWWMAEAVNTLAGSKGTKVINCLFDNTGHPGVWFANQGSDGEVSGCNAWGTGSYDDGGSFLRGTFIYAQNSNSTPIINGNISHRNFTQGMQAYGTAAQINGFKFTRNITIANGNTIGIAAWSVDAPATNIWVNQNYFARNSVRLGYEAQGNVGAQVLSNRFIIPTTVNVNYQRSGSYSNNFFLYDRNVDNEFSGDNGILFFDARYDLRSAVTWAQDRNTYYQTNGSDFSFSHAFQDISPSRGTYAAYRTATQFDSNSVWQMGWPNNHLLVNVITNDWDANLWHIEVENTTGTNTAWLDLAALGFAPGHAYQLRDANNYHTVIARGIFNGASLALPLTLTNLATFYGTITHFTPESLNVDYPGLFNAFVLERVPATITKTLRGNARLRGSVRL